MGWVAHDPSVVSDSTKILVHLLPNLHRDEGVQTKPMDHANVVVVPVRWLEFPGCYVRYHNPTTGLPRSLITALLLYRLGGGGTLE